jgi:hypothetical protein
LSAWELATIVNSLQCMGGNSVGEQWGQCIWRECVMVSVCLIVCLFACLSAW